MIIKKKENLQTLSFKKAHVPDFTWNRDINPKAVNGLT